MDRADLADHDDTTTADAALCQSWAEGDVGALAALVERHGALVHARCRRALPASDADDATQAVFLVLARRGDRAARSPALAAWLLRVADNVVRNALRDGRRRKHAERSAAACQRLEEPAASVDEAPDPELVARLGQALERLRPVEREAIQLHYLAGRSLAEVARASASGLSTVKERIGRGLDRLRADLERAGCACALPELSARLRAAAPPLSASARAHLCSALARPTHQIPHHIRRWMRQGPTMASLAASAAAVLVVGGAAMQCSLHAADHAAAPAPMPATRPVATPPAADDAAAIGDFYDHLDPERARSWVSVRWVDGHRTAERLQGLPEIALLPDHGAALLADVGSLTDATAWLCLDSMYPPDTLTVQYRLFAAMRHETLAEHVAAVSTLMDQQMERIRPGQSRFDITRLVLHARAHGSSADAPAIAWLSSLPQSDGGAAAAGSAPAPRGAASFITLPAAIQRTVGGANVAFDTKDDAPPVAMPPDVLAAGDADDLVVCLMLDDGHGHQRLATRASLQVRATGLHFESDAPLPPLASEGGQPPALVASRDALDRVPADALLACDIAASQEVAHTTAPWLSALHAMRAFADLAKRRPPTAAPLPVPPSFDHILAALARAQGQALLYVQPGMGLPSITVAVDMPKAACDDLVKALGHPIAEDGSTTIPIGMAVASVGWRGGRLLFTTNPLGLDACEGQGGFAKHPEVVAALKAMPDGPTSCYAILRPEALVGAIGPFLGMFAPQMAGQVPAYQARLQANQSYAFFSCVNTPQGVHEEASGLLAAVAGGFLISQMKSPSGVN